MSSGARGQLMNIEPGAGRAGTPVIIEARGMPGSWLYGWTEYDRLKALGVSHKMFMVKDITLDAYCAYLLVYWPECEPLLAVYHNKGPVTYEELLAIDQAIELTVQDATEIQHLQCRYDRGEIKDKEGRSLYPDG